MKNKLLKYTAASCFAILTVWDIVDIIRNISSGFGGVGAVFVVISCLDFIADALVTVALLTAIPAISTVGFVFYAMRCVGYVIYIIAAPYYPVFQWATLFEIISLAVSVLLMIAGLKPKYAKILGIIASALLTVRFIVNAVIHRLTVLNIVYNWLFIAGVLLFGLFFDNYYKNVLSQKSPTAASKAVPPQAFNDANVEKLQHLKTLLDEGIISKEEFDEKKKHILGF